MKVLIWIGVAFALVWLWRNAKPNAANMSVGEAAKLLGISENAGTDEIIGAHKRLIAKVHPDAGGSAELASRVNRARDTLLKRLGE